MEVRKSSMLLESLPEDAIENIKKSFNLDKPERLNEAIQILQEWIEKQDHIIKKDFSKRYLETSLIACKGSMEKAKKQIDKLCTMKTLMPIFFSKCNLKEELKDILQIAWLIPLPKPTKDYYRVILIKFNNKSFTSDNFRMYYQYNIIVSEYIKAHDYVNGLIIIHDYRDISLMEIITKMNTVELQQFMSVLIEGYGARIKSVHVITESKTVEVLIKIIKQFISEKIADRMHVHATSEHLLNIVPKEVMPIEYGGLERSVNMLQEEWVEELSSKEHVEYMKMISKACTDESKRLTGKFNEEYLGMPGTFRSLSVD